MQQLAKMKEFNNAMQGQGNLLMQYKGQRNVIMQNKVKGM